MSGVFIVTNYTSNSIGISTDGFDSTARHAYPPALTDGANMYDFLYNGVIGVGIGYDAYPTNADDKCLITSTNPRDSNSWVVQRNHPFVHPTNNPSVIGWNGSYWLIYSCPVDGTASTAGKISKSMNGTHWTTIADIGGFNITNSFIKRLIWSGNFWIASLSPTPSTNSVFLKSTDDGVTWTFVSNTYLNTVNDIQFNGSYFLATGTVADSTINQALVMKSTDCITWTPITLSYPNEILTKTFSPAWNGSYWLIAFWAANQRYGLLKSNAAGTTWTVSATNMTIPSFSPTHVAWDGIRWAAYATGYHYRSSDGNNWNKSSFAVQAKNTRSLEVPSIRIIYTAPGTPTDITVVAGVNSATVSWIAPASNGGSAITGYTITPSVGSPVTVGNVLTATVTGLETGTGVTFTVVAINSTGSSSVSPASPPVIPISPNTVAGAPTGVLATAGTNSATVSWTAPESNGGAVITGYTVIPSMGIAMTVGNVLTATLTGLASIYTITFRVYAINAIGSSLASAPSLPVTPNPTTVGPPSSVLGVTGIAGVASSMINWTPPVSNGGTAITGYKVICVPDNKKINTAAATATSLLVTGLKNATLTTFTVVALNSAGQSDSVSLTSYPLPGAPKVVAVRGESGVISLTWTAKAAHVDSPITGYVVSLFSPLPAPVGMVIPTPTVTVTGGSANISSLTNGDSYVFSVKSVSNIGQSATSGLSKALIAAGLPNVPTTVVGTKGLLSAQLTWLAPVNTGGLPITGYTISYTVADVVKTVSVKAVLTTIIKGLVNGTAYSFTIKAITLVGSSIASSPVTVTPGVGL